MGNPHHKKEPQDIMHGHAMIVAGTATNIATGRMARGWHLPGYGFTTSEVRARAVADELHKKLKKILED